MKIGIVLNKKLSVVLHVLAWLFIIILPLYLVNSFDDGSNRFLYHFYFNTTIYGSIFYINYLWLTPYFFMKDKKLLYFTITLGAIIILCLIMQYVDESIFFNHERDKEIDKIMQEMDRRKEHPKPPPMREFQFLNFVVTSILISGFSLGLRVMEELGKKEKEKKELEKEKLNSELAFLKNQISPHFFFNTLNNIYALIELDKSKAQESVHKLSKMMRYLLYDSEHQTSKLSDEISFMVNYIELMKLRLSEKVKLSFLFPTIYEDLHIPPLLFIPFIENAFKHGISYKETSFIEVHMTVEKNRIQFYTRNSIYKGNLNVENNQSGIGLENVKKRLGLLFPNSHKLEITTEDNNFLVELTLYLNNKNNENQGNSNR